MQNPAPESDTPKFSNRISRNLILGLVFLVALILSASYSIIWLEGRPTLQALHFDSQRQLGQNIVLGLEHELNEVKGVVQAVASSIAVVDKPDIENVASVVLPAILTSPKISLDFVGGGIWLEQKTTDHDLDHSHYVWRLGEGGVTPIDIHEERAENAGPHGHDLFLPTKLLDQDVFWSRSRKMPDKQHSVATISTPFEKDGELLGIASIDMNLKRIGEVLIQLIAGRQGYAFIVDSDNRFIVFPTLGFDVSRTQVYSSNHAFEYIDDLAQQFPQFAVISKKMDEIDRRMYSEMSLNFPEYVSLADRLTLENDGMDPFQARKIVANSWMQAMSKSAMPNPVGNFNIGDDLLLRGDAAAIVYQMPSTGWRIVTVFESKTFGAISDLISQKLFVAIFMSSLLFGVFAIILLKVSVIDRLRRMIDSLVSAVQKSQAKNLHLDYEQNDELGMLAYWFNQHAHQMENAIISARRADRAKSDFLSAMAKEMRTPINSILGFSRRLIVKLGGDLESHNYQTLVGIQRSANHLLSLVDDIVEISELESDRVHLKFDWQSVNMLLDDVSSQMSGQLADANLEFEVLPLREDARVYVDRQKIVQVLLHLLVNALQSTESGSVILKAEATVLATHDAVSFSVTDSSAGLSNQEKHQIFRQFSKIEVHAGKDKGIGPGLYLIREITALHSGAVFLESVIGVGTTFQVVIPISANLADQQTADTKA